MLVTGTEKRLGESGEILPTIVGKTSSSLYDFSLNRFLSRFKS
jgi:hypothetical protein